MDKISACVITHNEEHNIRRCLSSLTWCDEIVVLAAARLGKARLIDNVVVTI